MNQTDTQCDDIQQAIAVNLKLSGPQLAHVDGCEHCQAVRSEFIRLDGLLAHSIESRVPAGFADRVMAQLPALSPYPRHGGDLINDRLLTVFSRSPLLQALLLGLGVALGVGHIVRFFLGLFITSMAAAL